MKYLRGLLTFIIDIIRFPFEFRNPRNKFNSLLTFLFIEYPAYLRQGGPTRRKVWVFFPLVLYYILKPRDR